MPANFAGNLSVCAEGIFSPSQIGYRLYANMPIAICGILANIVNIVVFADSEMRTLLMNHFLLALSVSDLLLLIFNFFFLLFPVMVVNSDCFLLHDLYPAVVRYSYPLALTTQTCGVYLTVLVSVHRFLGVCHPFRTKRWVTRRPVQYAIISSIVFSVVINIPTWMELDIEPCFSKTFNRISSHITLTPLQRGWYYILVKKVVTYTTVMFVIPFIILIVVNWKIILALRQSTNLRTLHTYSTKNESMKDSGNHEQVLKQFRLLKKTKYSEMFQTFSKMSNASIFKPSSDLFKNKFTNSIRDRSVTLMLLAIVGIFLGCNGLAFCNNIIEILIVTNHQMTEEGDELFEKSVEISNILITYRSIVTALLKFQKRQKVNRVAITTAVAAHRAVELSLIPDEASTRTKKQIYSEDRISLNGKMIGSMGHNRRTLFRSQTTLTRSLVNSESNLRLMDCQSDEKSFVSAIN
ncbi:hypothetical protein FO519_003304 [Halicephalobus sp. NKZ332]|nr:hypothetical protein FO519_003304 [Halicephalobus sp. NKZ332]